MNLPSLNNNALISPTSIRMAKATADAFVALQRRIDVQDHAAVQAAQITVQERQRQRIAGGAATVTAIAVAGYLLWLIQGGALLLSVISTLPFWRWMDPLPVLESWKKASVARKRWWFQRRRREINKDEEQELKGIVD
jgi:hypothetical protein